MQIAKCKIKNDEVIKSPKVRFSVIPAKAGIQAIQTFINSLDSGSRI
jgi:hypothetical protein